MASYYLTVCLEIQLQIVGAFQNETNITLTSGAKVRWSLGTCSSVNTNVDNRGHQYGSLLVERCCIAPGKHTLTCDSTIPTRGWKNAYLTIDGRTYCDNFIGFQLRQKITVAGTSSVLNIGCNP